LDESEFFYHRIKINCVDYQSRTHCLCVSNDQSTNFPLERYLDIIVKGCEYYQVRSKYINQLKDEQPVIPRKQPDSLQSFTDVPPDVYYSRNGKILEHTGLPSADHPDYEFQRNFYKFSKQKLTGQEVTTVMAKVLYEPLYRLPSNDEDICDEHRARLEDHHYNQLAGSQNKIHWTSSATG
jgi:hypothetical protein